MRIIVQRVKRASVEVKDEVVGKIGSGLLVFLGVGSDDDESDLDYMVNKVLGLRIFQDEEDKMNLSLKDTGGELLVVSQFTLYGDVRKGKRPSFTASASPDMGEKFYEKFVDKCRENEIKVETGIFGADMQVSLINDGPVTIMLDSKKTF